jgi:hypothetical protein
VRGMRLAGRQALLTVALVVGALGLLTPGEAGTCSGGANCTACSTCGYCGHCAGGGGTCSVCNPKADPRPTRHARPQKKRHGRKHPSKSAKR